MILHIENPKDTTRKHLEPISEFGNDVVYKIKAKKSHAFLYTNKKRSEREIKKTILFTISSKRIKYLGITLPKEKKGLYSKKCRRLMKDLEDDIHTVENIYHVLGLKELILWKWLYYPRQSTDSM